MGRLPKTGAFAAAFAAALVALVAAPQVALACPTCAGDAGNNYTFLKLGALMSLVPFAIVGAILWVVRNAPREETRETHPSEGAAKAAASRVSSAYSRGY